MSNNILLLDFGSTYTKANLIDLKNEVVQSQAIVKTSIKTDLMDSYQEVVNRIKMNLNKQTLTIDKTFVCSSAFGGFKMVAIGLTHSLTASAAKKAALGAGTRILKTYAYDLSSNDIDEINKLEPDVILLTGGTDGGNSQFILNCVSQLVELEKDIPVIVAGNNQLVPSIKRLFPPDKTYYITENVMPKINLLKTDEIRKILRQIFFEKIIYAKGLERVAELTEYPILPTPTAVLSAANLLSKGTKKVTGLGDLVVIDVGGATTDVHSISESISGKQEVIYEGLEEPLLKRTVEGDLGMRYSAISLYEAATTALFNHYSLKKLDDKTIVSSCERRVTNPEFIPTSSNEKNFDTVMAKIAIDLAIERHAGKLRRHQTATHDSFYQAGKDLRYIAALIGTGGVIINNSDPKDLLHSSLQKDEETLRPINPIFYSDSSYLLSTLGLLGEHYPDIALRIMKRELSTL